MLRHELTFDLATERRAWRRDRSPWWRDALLRRMLAIGDVASGALVALFLAHGTLKSIDVGWLAALLPAWIVLAKLHGLYDRDQRALRTLTVDELPRIALWALAGTATTAIVIVRVEPQRAGMAWIVGAWALACGSAVVLRCSARSAWRRLTPPEGTLVVGSGPLAEATRRKLDLFRDMHLRLVGVADPAAAFARLDSQSDGIDRLILASQVIDERLIADLLAYCKRESVKLSVVPPVRAMFGTAVELHKVADVPFLQYNTWDVSRSTLLLKRVLDLCVSVVAVVLLAPVAALTAVAIRLETPGPIIFVQRRAGHHGRPFRMFKFRTMIADAEEVLPELVPFDELPEPVFKLRDDPRVTRVGRFLRRTSLDELPQLVNVLLGDMSLVGPRPEQVELVDRYGAEERVRLAVKPGMTGPMQVSGRGELTLDERVAVEREYVENLTLGRDLRILAMTMPAVVGARGAF